ncbi:unnamed protein product [Rotaria socialis]|uniref:Mid2 domain-containing protein n=1 Tax=Rotaria socialis TaxID=392032 RepID=A0A819A7R8_9BILA|nr:unnamed protein product [Rotaria socialis]CAF3186196.1 unnamed protein product [Rotaria socialis]CAF3669619.1 unnamed protein product [Rotaria socialis]CAF3773618.1 unnamed protein product [Rotaria socialis]CAF4161877.1 unnamed protein product [Rotaria socialis]
MFFIQFILGFISIDIITSTLTLNNISSSRAIILASCQADKNGLESISIPNSHHYYFYVSSQFSSSLSSSSSVSSVLNLSYCEHQQTTYYSSSGFSILHSSPRFPSTKIQDKKNSIPFQTHNAVLSAVDQSLRTTSDTIPLTLSSSSNRNRALINHDDGIVHATINPLTTSILSNISLIHTSLPTITEETQKMSIISLIGCIACGIIIIIIIYSILKYCCNRDKGSYKIDESTNFTTRLNSDNQDGNGCTGKILSPNNYRQTLLTTNEANITESKEWYV